MAGQFDAHYVCVDVGTLAGTSVYPLFKNIAGNGCINVLDANMTPGAVAGTGIWRLVYTPGSVGTAAYGATDGTIGTFGSAANIGTAYRPLTCTISAAVVPPNAFVALEFAGTAGGDALVSSGYLKGQ